MSKHPIAGRKRRHETMCKTSTRSLPRVIRGPFALNGAKLKMTRKLDVVVSIETMIINHSDYLKLVPTESKILNRTQ